MPTALDLFERHHVAVFRFVRRMGLPLADAEDLTQEVFLRVVRAVSAYQDRQSERAWVFRIARNMLNDHWRAGARAPAAEPLSEGDHPGLSPPRVDGLALGEALGRLAQAEREAFLLREVGGLSYTEIAEAIAATSDAVRNRIHRARLALRRELGPGRVATRTAEGPEA